MRSRMLPCEKCGRVVAVRSKGLCPACRAKELPPRTRVAARAKAKPRGKSLSVFFGAHVARLSMIGRSLTGARIACPGIGNICHLYPKRKYKSVAEDDDNVVYLTIGEHARFDCLLDTMDFDRLLVEFGDIWLSIAGRMRDLAPRVKEDGKLKTRLLLWIEENRDCFCHLDTKP